MYRSSLFSIEIKNLKKWIPGWCHEELRSVVPLLEANRVQKCTDPPSAAAVSPLKLKVVRGPRPGWREVKMVMRFGVESASAAHAVQSVQRGARGQEVQPAGWTPRLRLNLVPEVPASDYLEDQPQRMRYVPYNHPGVSAGPQGFSIWQLLPVRLLPMEDSGLLREVPAFWPYRLWIFGLYLPEEPLCPVWTNIDSVFSRDVFPSLGMWTEAFSVAQAAEESPGMTLSLRWSVFILLYLNLPCEHLLLVVAFN